MLGEPGIGKTTTIYQMAEKEFGEDGYLLLDVGSEWGSEYINGVVAEQTETFKKFMEVTNDIIKNKDTEYPNLKVVIIDTIDSLFEIGEPYLVKLYNELKRIFAAMQDDNIEIPPFQFCFQGISIEVEIISAAKVGFFRRLFSFE